MPFVAELVEDVELEVQVVRRLRSWMRSLEQLMRLTREDMPGRGSAQLLVGQKGCGACALSALHVN